MLSLSELPISEGESANVQGWMKERDDLLTTVESLKGLITHIQIKVEATERLCIHHSYYLVPVCLPVWPLSPCRHQAMRTGEPSCWMRCIECS